MVRKRKKGRRKAVWIALFLGFWGWFPFLQGQTISAAEDLLQVRGQASEHFKFGEWEVGFGLLDSLVQCTPFEELDSSAKSILAKVYITRSYWKRREGDREGQRK